MKKIFSILFIFYIVSLMVFPCDHLDEFKSSDEHIVISSEHQEHEHEDDIERCTPFCMCSHCHNYFLETKEAKEVHTIENPQYTIVEENLILTESKDIFKPPNLL